MSRNTRTVPRRLRSNHLWLHGVLVLILGLMLLGARCDGSGAEEESDAMGTAGAAGAASAGRGGMPPQAGFGSDSAGTAAGFMDDSGTSGAGTGALPEAGRGNTGACVRGGCSNQLCLEASEEDVATTCEWQEAYGCYAEAPCARQPDGACAHTPSTQLTRCLEAAGQAAREACPPCVAPPFPSCVGTGPCGCGPYVCP